MKAFRTNKVDHNIIKAEFMGEQSVDAGGPYRETLTNLCQDL